MRVNRERFQKACNILRDSITITEYLEKEGHVKYGLEYETGMIRCPFPDHDDRTPSFSYNEDKKVFHCFGCDRGGDIVNLHYHFKEAEDDRYTRTKAVRELSNTFQVVIPDLYIRDFKQGRVNEYKRSRVDMMNLSEEFYKEKIKGYEKNIRGISDDDKRVRIYRLIDDMYLGKRDVKEVFNRIRKEIR